MLTSIMIQGGLRGLGIDSLRNRHRKVGPVAVFDLTVVSNVDTILKMIREGEVDIIHAAPPCGTATRAREIRVKGGPLPLRSEQYPEGLLSLQGLDAEKVASANCVYKHIALILHEGDLYGCLCSAENPARSYMWLTRWWRAIFRAYFQGLFQACMHGSQRDKWSLWVANWLEVQSLSAVCDQKHEHAPWGRLRSGAWATADEAAYPRLLCVRYMQHLFAALLARGAVFPPVVLDENWAMNMLRNQAMAVSSVKQPRGRRCPPLVKEFKEVIAIQLPAGSECTFRVGQCLTTVFREVPVGSKLIRRSTVGVDGSSELVFGIPWTPTEFHYQATTAKHPFQMQAPLPDPLLKVIFQLVTCGPEAVCKSRLEKLLYWNRVAKDLETDEVKLHESLHPDVSKVLSGKRLLLFKRMLEESGYVDTELFSDVCSGFEVTGMAKNSHAFVKDVRLPPLTESELLSSARWTRHSTIGSVGPSGDADLDNQVWAETQDEVQRGWLIPVLDEDLDRRFGKGGWSPARRFGLRQGDGFRSIDDYSLPMTNFAFGSAERLDLMGVDEVAATFRLLAQLLSQPWSSVGVVLRDGTKLRGRKHQYWVKRRSTTALLGRNLDLSKAYRNLASSPKSARWCIIVVYCPVSRSAALFYQPVLAFGASSAVLGFNRVSRALWWLGVVEFSLIWLSYFDDFPSMEVAELTTSAVAASEGLMSMLGWEVSRKPLKHFPFLPQFVSLGVLYDLSFLFRENVLVVDNKPGRVPAITTFVRGAIVKGRVTSLELDSLRGKLQYAESQTFGRLARYAFSPIQAACKGASRLTVFITDEIRLGLELVCRALENSKPRRIPLQFPVNNILTFTDGACEGEQFSHVTAGASIVEPGPAGKWWFHIVVPAQLAESWRDTGDKQRVIAEAELFPVLVCRAMLSVHPEMTLIVHYVDNDGVSDSLVKGTSAVSSLRDMLHEYALQELRFSLVSWIARVASASNPGDGPSRSSQVQQDGLDRGLDRSTEALVVAQSLTALFLKNSLSQV